MKRIAPSQRMEQELFTGFRTCGDPIGETARRGAQMILQKLMEWEADDFLGRVRYERFLDGALRGHRNGYGL